MTKSNGSIYTINYKDDNLIELSTFDIRAILLYVPLDLEQQKYIFLVLQVQVFKTKYATYI